MGAGYPFGDVTGARQYLDRANEAALARLRELKINMRMSVVQSEPPDSYLFKGLFSLDPEIYVPVAILASDGMLYFYLGEPRVKNLNEPRHDIGPDDWSEGLY